MQKKTKKPFYKAFIDFFLKSLIVSSLCSFTSAIYKKIACSISAAAVTSYEFISEKLMASKIVKRILPDKYKRLQSSLTLRISKLYDQSILSAVISRIKWSFLACPLNIIGIFGLTFGFTSTLMLILENFAFTIGEISISGILALINPLMTSLVFIVVAILFIFSKKPLIRAVNESLFLGFILFDFLSIRKIPVSDYENQVGMSAGVASLTGILLGGIAVWVTPSAVAVTLGIIIVTMLVLHSPEAGVIGMIFSLPFLPTKALIFLSVTTVVSFFLKCSRRKRLMKFEGLDIFVAVFALFIISGGVISVDVFSSAPKMLVYVCFLAMYYIVKNVVRTETLILSCARSLAASSMLVAFIGIMEYLFGSVSQIWQDTSMFGEIRGRAVSTFENPNVLGEYLITVIPILFAMFLCSKKFNLRALFFVSFALCLICLAFTWSRGAWLGFIFSAIIFVLMKSPLFLAGTILSAPTICLAFTLTSESNFLQRIMSIGNMADSSTAYRVDIWRGVWKAIADKGLYGIGIGQEAFASVFPQYALAGTETAPHAHSLYLQMIIETGVFSLIIFAVICLSYLSLTFSYIRKSPGSNSRVMSLGFLGSICAFLIQSFADYTWYNYRIYLFFWLMLGFAMAVLNLCKENDKRKFIYR